MLHTWIGLFEHHDLSHIIRGEAEQNVAELLVHLDLLEYRFARIVHFYTRSLQKCKATAPTDNHYKRQTLQLFELSFGNVTGHINEVNQCWTPVSTWLCDCTVGRWVNGNWNFRTRELSYTGVTFVPWNFHSEQ